MTLFDEPMMTTKEVSEMTGTPASTLRGWKHRNKGPQTYKREGSVRYRRVDVEAWWAAGREPNGEATA